MRPMTVGDLLRALADVPRDVVVEVEHCREPECSCTHGMRIRSVEIESGQHDGQSLPLRVWLTRLDN